MQNKFNIFQKIRSIEKKNPKLYWLVVLPIWFGFAGGIIAFFVAIYTKKFEGHKYPNLDVVDFIFQGIKTGLISAYVFSFYNLIGEYFEKRNKEKKDKLKKVNKTNKARYVVAEFVSVSGESNGVHVSISPFPYGIKGEKKRYIYPEFGSDFHNELFEVQLPDWDIIKETIDAGRAVSANVQLRKYDKAIKVDISCSEEYRKSKFYKENEFYSLLADAIIDALDKNNIKP